MTNNDIKIAFFGTSDRSIPLLETLKKNFSLKLCITKKDSLFGRDQVSKPTQVKVWAKENSVNVIEVESLKKSSAQEEDEGKSLIDQLNYSGINLGVVADFSLIIPKAIIDTPKYKLINIHFSLLPLYRGASPVQFALINGDSVSGITYYLMDEKMDTGDILYQIEYNVPNKINSSEMYLEMFQIASENLPKVITLYVNGNLTPLSQDNAKATYTYSKSHPKNTFIYKEDAQIDWLEGLEIIERKVRAYYPWPIAWTTLKDLEQNTLQKEGLTLKTNKTDLKMKIYDTNVENQKLQIKRVQVEGKKIMTWKEFLNGYAIKQS